MKRIFIALAMLTMTLAASAQFEKDKKYVAANLNGIDMSYNGSQHFQMDVDLAGGLFVDDNWLIRGQVGYVHDKTMDPHDRFVIGAGIRYYIQQNGLFVGLNCKAKLAKRYHDLLPGMELGYCFFVNDKLTIEPALYYDQSIRWHKDYSTVGLKVGLGVYF